MKEYYFVSRLDQKPRAPLVERELIQEASNLYMDRIVSSDQLEEIVESLQESQEDMIAATRRLNRVEIRVEKYDHMAYLYVGKSSLWLRPIRCSDKESAASEIFNDGWWNCFETFAAYVRDSRIFEYILTDANVSSPEAFMRADLIGSKWLADVVRRYGETQYME